MKGLAGDFHRVILGAGEEEGEGGFVTPPSENCEMCD